MQGWRLPVAGALALSIGLTPILSMANPAAAAPAVMPPGIAKAEADSAVLQVRRYRHFHRHHHHGHRGRNLGIGLGIGILGGIIAAEAYRSAPGYAYDEEVYDAPAGDARVQCAREFRSFEWDTGLYTTYSGEKKLCPYLR